MPRKPERPSTVASQPVDEIESEIMGSIAHLDNGDDSENDQDDPANAPPASIPASKAKEVGALNAPAVQSNRRRKAVIDRKREGEKNVPWGEHDACLLYDDIVSIFPPSTVIAHVTRVTGSRTSWYLQAQPRNGMELHETIKSTIHGVSPECEYQVIFRDRIGRQERGRGSIVMPSTEFDAPAPPSPQAPPQAAPPAVAAPLPPPPPPPPPQYPQQGPPQYPQQGYPQQGYPPQQFAPQPHGPPYEPPPMQRPRWADERPPPRESAPPPVVQQQPNADPVVVMQLQKQLSDIQAQLQGIGARSRDPMAQQLADIQTQLDRLNNRPQPTPNAPMPVMQQQPPPAPVPQVVVQAPPPSPPPAPVKMPEVPPGYALTMINGMPCFVPLRDLGLGVPAPAPAPVPVAPVAVAPAAPPAPPPPPQTMAEQFASTLGSVKSAIAIATQMRDILPEPQAPMPIAPPPTIAAVPAPTPEAPSPTKVVKIGEVTTVQNVEDGSIRLMDTAIANGPAILGWLDKQRNEYLAKQDAIARGLPMPQPQPQQPQQTSQIGVPIIPGR